MPRRIGELTETGIIAEMRAELRRLWRAVGSNQSPVGEYIEFTLASSSDSAHTLTYIPSLSLIPIACLNGLPGRYGTDYTVDFSTGIVTWSATKVAGDILSVFYQTTGDLVALSGAADIGGVITDTYNRPDASTLGATSDGNATWTDQALTSGTFQILSNTAYMNGTQGAGRIATVPTGHADGTLTLDVLGLTSSEAGGPCFRYSDNNNFWFVECLSTAGTSSVYKKTAGSISAVGSPFTITGGTAACEVDLSGSSVIVKVNGTTVLTTTNSFNSTATVHGIYATGGVSVRLDNFNWTPA